MLSGILLSMAVSVGAGPASNAGVVFSSAGETCLALSGAPLPVGSVVTVVLPDVPQRVLGATVEGPLDSCEMMTRSGVVGPFYRLALQGRVPDGPLLGVAAVGAPRPIAADGLARLTWGQFKHASVRSCTSREGLHLTIWEGEPLKTRRLWHHYWYLGYDVEPSCVDADVEESGPEAEVGR